MKLLFIFFSSTGPLILFEMAIYFIPLLMVVLCILLVYCIELYASNDDDCTILSYNGAYGKLPKTIQFGF